MTNVYEIRATKRARQLAEIAVACARLEQRKCKCGCGIKYRVFPESELIYGTTKCAQKAGWKPKYRFEPPFDHTRRWVWVTPGIDAPACA